MFQTRHGLGMLLLQNMRRMHVYLCLGKVSYMTQPPVLSQGIFPGGGVGFSHLVWTRMCSSNLKPLATSQSHFGRKSTPFLGIFPLHTRTHPFLSNVNTRKFGFNQIYHNTFILLPADSLTNCNFVNLSVHVMEKRMIFDMLVMFVGEPSHFA